MAEQAESVKAASNVTAPSNGDAVKVVNNVAGAEPEAIGQGTDRTGQPEVRQDAYVIFSNEKDLRHHESIRIKSQLYTGIAVRTKFMTPAGMENLLHAIQLDGEAEKPKKNKSKEEVKDELLGKKKEEPAARVRPRGCIINLRLEETRIMKKAASYLADFLRQYPILETIGFARVTFEDFTDFKKIMEGVQQNSKLQKITFQHMVFDEEVYGKAIGRALTDSRSLRELDISYVTFEHPKSFYDVCSAILNERCRLNVFKLRGISITQLEGKILQYILMKNKTLSTMDISHCRADESENFEFFLQKLDQFCNIRYLTIENLQPDISGSIEVIGEALSENTKLEALVLRENKIKWVPFCAFWTSVVTNKTLQKINLQKTDMQDKVVEKMALYLKQDDIALIDLDVSRNHISDVGLKYLCAGMKENKGVRFLNLSGNKIKEEAMEDLVDLLSTNTIIEELSLGGNIISNDGISALSKFLDKNKTLQHLDIGKNSFTDVGFDEFAKAIGYNNGIKFLDISKNKDVSDEASLITLAEALVHNSTLRTIDFTGLQVRKPYLKQHLDVALQKNITLQKVLGKIPPQIINHELDLNVIIEKEILPCYQKQVKLAKHLFNLALVEPNEELHSYLDLRGKPPKLMKGAFKFIQNYDVRMVDFSNIGFHDDAMSMLSSYLRQNPNLRSVKLDNNLFTDAGILQLAEELKLNTKLVHLSIRGCTGVTDDGLKELNQVIATINTVLFQVDLDYSQFDEELAQNTVIESKLNRDIQENLKPRKILSNLNYNYSQLSKEQKQNDEDLQISARQQLIELNQTKKKDIKETIKTIDTINNELDESIVQAHNEPAESSNANLEDTLNPLKKSETNLTNSLSTGFTMLKREVQKEVKEEDVDEVLYEVQFDKNATVAECFQSALKCWRIFQPNVIIIEQQDLTDSHVEQLCQFLSSKDMVSHLNVRRNKISNEGAKRLAQFILEEDNTLTHLDIERNRVGQDGGASLLEALSTTTRIIECKIVYGNPISSKMGRDFEREIKANAQAVESNRNKKKSKVKWELIDKGPDYMRCAIKMTELKNIIYLSLPDNMLGLEDARMLSDLLIKNTPLRNLNLSKNSLDADCAALLANSLIYNNNLKFLDVSNNMIGDLGVFIILMPLIRKELQATSITEKKTPVIPEKELKIGSNFTQNRSIKNGLQILQQLNFINVENNMTTNEIFKIIHLALIVNEKVSIKVENPGDQKRADTQEDEDEALIFEVSTSSKVQPGLEMSEDQELITEHSTLENSEDEDKRIQMLLAKERKDAERRKKLKAFKRRRALINCLRRVVCFQDDQNAFDEVQKIPTCKQVCCWRLLRARRRSHRFHASKDSLEAFEKSKSQCFVMFLISINYIILYGVLLYPFVLIAQEKLSGAEEDTCVYGIDEAGECLTEGDTMPIETEEQEKKGLDFNEIMLIVNGGVLLYQLICELIMIAAQKGRAKLSCCNQYLLIQVFNGVTLRGVILISAQLVAAFITQVGVISYTIGIVLAVSLIFSQFRALQIFTVALKRDVKCLLPNIERNYKLSMSTFFFGNAVIYKKLSAEPSVRANERYKEMIEEKERLMSFSGYAEDENKGRKIRLKDRLKCKICKFGSPKYWQMVLNDIPLLMAIPCAYLLGLVDQITMIVALFMTLSDFISMVTYLLHDDELSIESEKIYHETERRIRENRTILKELEINSDDEQLHESNSLEKQDEPLQDNPVSQPQHGFDEIDTLQPDTKAKFGINNSITGQSPQNTPRGEALASNRTEQPDAPEIQKIEPIKKNKTRRQRQMEEPEVIQLSVKKKKEGEKVNFHPSEEKKDEEGEGDDTDREFRFAEQQELGKMVDVISIKNAKKENFMNVVSATMRKE